MEIIQPAQSAPPKGHYSPGIKHNGVIYVSGQLPIRGDGTVADNIGEQTQCCLENIETILAAGGSSLRHILKLTIFISDIQDWQKVNEVIAKVMGDHKPARIVVPVNRLNYGCIIEMDAIAAAP